MRFVKQLHGENEKETYLIRATDIGNRTAFYIFMLNAEMKNAFLKLKPNEPADLNDYGIILASGFGDNVPENIKSKLMTRYKIKIEE